jgi:hypothetical protein
VVVKIHASDGKLMAATQGVGKEQAEWRFKIAGPLPPLEDITLTVEATDKTGNITRVVQQYGAKAQAFHDWRGSPHGVASF